jgi:hypothetical protein
MFISLTVDSRLLKSILIRRKTINPRLMENLRISSPVPFKKLGIAQFN